MREATSAAFTALYKEGYKVRRAGQLTTLWRPENASILLHTCVRAGNGHNMSCAWAVCKAAETLQTERTVRRNPPPAQPAHGPHLWFDIPSFCLPVCLWPRQRCAGEFCKICNVDDATSQRWYHSTSESFASNRKMALPPDFSAASLQTRLCLCESRWVWGHVGLGAGPEKLPSYVPDCKRLECLALENIRATKRT